MVARDKVPRRRRVKGTAHFPRVLKWAITVQQGGIIHNRPLQGMKDVAARGLENSLSYNVANG